LNFSGSVCPKFRVGDYETETLVSSILNSMEMFTHFMTLVGLQLTMFD